MQKKYLLLLLCFLINSFISVAQDLPANPGPGKCYVKCITKDTFKEITETVQVYPEYSTLEVIPAIYKTVTEKVLVKEASKKFVYVPATYETVDVSYIKKAERTDLEVLPANFGKDSKRFTVKPKTSGWAYKILEDCPSANKDDCVAACFVENPAEYQNVSLTTLTSDASTKTVEIPEQQASYQKRVIKTPARMDEIEIPAEFTTITKRVLDVPAKTLKNSIPAKMETVTKSVLDKKGGVSSWEPIDCEYLNPTLLPIFYDLGSARLTPASKDVINDVLLPLLKDSNISIEIMSHTDSRSNDDFNMALSKQRAQSVVNYLVSKGVSRNRLTSRGFGETRLTNRCANGVDCSEAQHQKNRRTEFRVLGN